MTNSTFFDRITNYISLGNKPLKAPIVPSPSGSGLSTLSAVCLSLRSRTMPNCLRELLSKVIASLNYNYMLAVIKTGGKQYLVQPGDKIKVEKLDKKEGEVFVFSDVLLVEKNKKVEIGTPVVKEVKVEAKILSHGRRDKIIVFKYKAKKRYSRKIGHRQPYTEIEITSIKN